MTYGPDTVAELIEEDGMTYPLTVAQLERGHALTNVQIDKKGNTMMIGELLEDIDTNRFEDENDLRKSFEPAFEAERERRNVGILGKIKQLFLGTYTR